MAPLHAHRGHRPHWRRDCRLQYRYHLVAAGCKNVLVIERETSRQGIHGQEHGGVRAQFSTPVNPDVALLDPFYASFEERLGYPCDYVRRDIFCATSEKHLAYLRANYEKQVAMG